MNTEIDDKFSLEESSIVDENEEWSDWEDMDTFNRKTKMRAHRERIENEAQRANKTARKKDVDMW